MAVFYALKDGAGRLRYFVTEGEARAALQALSAKPGAAAPASGRDAAARRASQAGGRADLAAGGRANPGARAGISQVEVDELIMRQWAANWANQSEVRREAAKRREASKTPEQRSEIMRKAWQKRKES